jgi:hypothetical protein
MSDTFFTKAREDFLTLYVDPGETTGWALGLGMRLCGGDQMPMWEFADEVWAATEDTPAESQLGDPGYLRDDVPESVIDLPIKRMVVEDFRLYPHVMRTGALDWNPVRTARLIGALTFIAHQRGMPFVTQPASIKKAAQAAGAEELYMTPTHDNRHHNDAIQHYVYFTHTQLMGINMPARDEE